MYDYLDLRQTERLKELVPYKALTPDADEIIKELDRLNNIINELEKEIISQIEICKEGQVLEAKARSPFDTYSDDIRAYKYLLDKLKELKENK